MTTFQQNTETLRTQLEKGDVATICERAKCSIGALYGAWSKTEASELSQTEQRAYDAFMSVVQERMKQKEQLNQRASKVAEMLQK